MTIGLQTYALALSLLVTPAAVLAQCSALHLADVRDSQQGNAGLALVGLQTALQDDDVRLRDGNFGSYAKVRLVDLCDAYPLPAGVDPVSGTLQMAEEYGALTRLAPLWFAQTSSEDFARGLLPAEGELVNHTILALAGPPALTAQILIANAAQPSCDKMKGVGLPPLAQTGLAALRAIAPDRWPDAAAICMDLALTGGADGTTAALTSFGRFEAALPGSLAHMMTPDFASWLGEAITTRGPRLVGSDDAVVALVAQYWREGGIDACRRPNVTARLTEYIDFDQAALKTLTGSSDITALLAPLTQVSFPTADGLDRAVSDALEGRISACALTQVRIAMRSDDKLGLAFSLNVERVAALAMREDQVGIEPVVASMIAQTAPTQNGLMSIARVLILEAKQAQFSAQVELAADALVAAVEPVTQRTDTPAVGLDDQIAPIEPAPTFAVTDATDVAIAATIQDEDFRQALVGSEFSIATTPEIVKHEVRRFLAPVVERKITEETDAALRRLNPAVESSWGLTAPLMAAITAAPNLAAAKAVGDDPALTDILESLVGTQYPTTRLFDAAIQSFGQADFNTLLPDLRNGAFRRGGDPARLQDWDIAARGCGCYGQRDANAAVYGFFPYWLASGLPTDPPVEQTQTSQRIDFGLVNRAAFYGLEFALSDPDDAPAANRVVLHNEIAWTNGQRGFVNAAHRHDADADLAVKISGWANWNQTEIDWVVSEIGRLTQPFDRMENWNLAAFTTAFPNLLDGAHADGVTLIIDGYSGDIPATPKIDNLIGLIAQLGPVLKARGQTLNVAFDLPLINTETSDPLFADIAGLLVGETPLVNLVLVFLERPTADSKKKLRARLENGPLQGKDLADVLRRIIPVLPSTGHENIRHGGGSNAGEPFGQFVDDLVYFQDNFAGVGFWPTPDPSAVETAGLTQRIAGDWFGPRLPGLLSRIEKPFERALLFVSLNRVLIATITIALLLLIALGLLRAFRLRVK